jgi:hypothetical protein
MQLFSNQKCSFFQTKNAAFSDPKMQLFSNQKCSFFQTKNATFFKPKMQLFLNQKCSLFFNPKTQLSSNQKCSLFKKVLSLKKRYVLRIENARLHFYKVAPAKIENVQASFLKVTCNGFSVKLLLCLLCCSLVMMRIVFRESRSIDFFIIYRYI